MSSTIIFGGLRSLTWSIQMPKRSASAARLSLVASNSVSNRPNLAGRCAAALDSPAADDPPHRRIAPQPVGVVHVLVPGETTIDGLAKETDDAVPTVLAGRSCRSGCQQ